MPPLLGIKAAVQRITCRVTFLPVQIVLINLSLSRRGAIGEIVQFSARGNADRHIVGDDARKQLVHKRNITFDLLRDRATAGPLILVETS